MFQTIVGILGEAEAGPSLSQLVRDHLVVLTNEFERYFPSSNDPRQTNEWVRNPFVNIQNQLSTQEEDQLTEIANDGGLKNIFDQTSLTGFWAKTKAEYLEIAVKALKTLLPFPTTYLCEAGFSAMVATKAYLTLPDFAKIWKRFLKNYSLRPSHI